MIKFIPNLFTLGNLLCGTLGIIAVFSNQFHTAGWLVLLAAFLDFFDGFFARLLKVDGELGKQLDSLADGVTFGVLPGLLVYRILDMFPTGEGWKEFLPYAALAIPLFSIYRLAKFNIDTRQSNSFIGLPTPANALFFVGLVMGTTYQIHYNAGVNENPLLPEYVRLLNGNTGLFFQGNTYSAFVLNTPELLAVLSLVFSYLLVAELPLFALKFKSFGWNGNEIRFLFLVLAVVLLIIFQLGALPFIVLLYLLISIVNLFIRS